MVFGRLKSKMSRAVRIYTAKSESHQGINHVQKIECTYLLWTDPAQNKSGTGVCELISTLKKNKSTDGE